MTFAWAENVAFVAASKAQRDLRDGISLLCESIGRYTAAMGALREPRGRDPRTDYIDRLMALQREMLQVEAPSPTSED